MCHFRNSLNISDNGAPFPVYRINKMTCECTKSINRPCPETYKCAKIDVSVHEKCMFLFVFLTFALRRCVHKNIFRKDTQPYKKIGKILQ